MPELPEVETVKNGLIQAVLNKKIVGLNVRNPNLRNPVPVGKLNLLIPGSKIVDITRRAKYLLLYLNVKNILIIHLGMSGQLLLCSEEDELNKHDHVIFRLEPKGQLRFRDPRRFGLIDICSDDRVARYPLFKNLGVEPLSDSFTFDYCLSKAGKSQRSLKSALLDSSFVTGLGNIYVNESLFRAGLHPQRTVNSLKKSDWKSLVFFIGEVLREAIKKGGTTLKDEGFQNVLGSGGHFQIDLKIYGKTGENCRNCGGLIVRFVQQNRSSFVCPDCQK